MLWLYKVVVYEREPWPEESWRSKQIIHGRTGKRAVACATYLDDQELRLCAPKYTRLTQAYSESPESKQWRCTVPATADVFVCGWVPVFTS